MVRRLKAWIVDRLGVDAIAARADHLQSEVRALHAVQDDLLREAASLRADLSATSALASSSEMQARAAAAWAEIGQASAWAGVAPLRHEPLISVVMATRNRSALLRRAIGSVAAQSYANWELLAVDDASTDDTADVLADAAEHDERIVVLRADGGGAGAARNRGLAAATGDYVAFIDDDNVMAPGWLRAVAEYTGRVPECDVLYGAQLRETEPDEIDPGRVDHGAAGGLRELHLLFVSPYHHDRMCTDNFVDLGALAVRRSHPELRFDESLEVYIDWEMIVRLATATPPHPLPVIASCYSTTATDRITATVDRPLRLAELRERFAACRGRGA